MFHLIVGFLSALCIVVWSCIVFFTEQPSEQTVTGMALVSVAVFTLSIFPIKLCQTTEDWRWGGLVRAPRWLIVLWRWSLYGLPIVAVSMGLWLQVNSTGMRIRNMIRESDYLQMIIVVCFFTLAHLWVLGFVVFGDEVAISNRGRRWLAQSEGKVMGRLLGFWDRLRGKR